MILSLGIAALLDSVSYIMVTILFSMFYDGTVLFLTFLSETVVSSVKWKLLETDFSIIYLHKLMMFVDVHFFIIQLFGPVLKLS